MADQSTWPKCPNGHFVHPRSTFCGECGQQVRPAEVADDGIIDKIRSAVKSMMPEWKDIIWAEIVDKLQERGTLRRLDRIEDRLYRIEMLFDPQPASSAPAQPPPLILRETSQNPNWLTRKRW